MRALVPPPLLRPSPGAPAAVGALLAFGVGWAVVGSLVSLVAAERAGAGPVVWRWWSAPDRWPGPWAPWPPAGCPAAAPRRWAAWLLAALGTAGWPRSLRGAARATALLVAAWAVAGAGVGIGYPVLYVAATDAGTVPGTAALTLATAVVSAEAVGELAGGAVGPSAVPLLDTAGLPGLALATAAAAAAW